jgi:hypothetical protein
MRSLPRAARPDRRGFLALAGAAAGGASLWALGGCRSAPSGGEATCDVAVVGGGLGGCAAALAACDAGARVLLVEESGWLGGQLTTQAVPPDEHRFVETHGCTESYRALRREVRAHYRREWPLTEAARASERLNPGGGWVSRLCCEPRAALAGIQALLAPHVAAGRLIALFGSRPVAAEIDADEVRSVRLATPGGPLTVVAPYFVDATEVGDLLPLAGVEHVTGSEARADTGEPHAAPVARPGNVQAVTWVIALEHRAGEDHTIDPPEQYAFWREYVPRLEPPWPGRLLAWETTHPLTLQPRTLGFSPLAADEASVKANLWTYRRVRRASNLTDPQLARDVTAVNWPQNDYLLGDPLVGEAETRARHAEGARQLTLSLLRWLQTEAPRPDGGLGWPGLRPCPEVMGTSDGLAQRPYVREGRRIVAERTLVEQDIEPEARAREAGVPVDEARAREFPDSVGVGLYGEIDLHPTVGGDSYRSVGCLPFQLPLGALLPVRVSNLLPGCKNAGTTHITNGVCRLHPVEWNVGEVAGALAAFCLARGTTPRAVRATPQLLVDFQAALVARGVELAWS